MKAMVSWRNLGSALLIPLILSYGLLCWAEEKNTRPDLVAINTREPAYTVYLAFQKSQLKTSLDDFKIKTKMNVVTLEELEKNADLYMRSRIVRNDYPNQDAVGGLLQLIKLGFAADGLGLTWNGGIALTFNDFQYAKKSYNNYMSDKAWKNVGPQNDPVNPANHLRLLDPNYLKTLEK